MNWKTWIPLVLAVVLGLVAMKVARNMMTKGPGPVEAPGTEIVILNKDLPAGSAINPDDLGTTRMTGTVNADTMFTRVDDVQGRVLIAPAMKGGPVLQTMLAPKGAGAGLQALIPDGMRAITIEINEFTGVAGNITSGAHVDITATMNGEQGEMQTRTIVQNVKVQSLGMRRTENGDAPPQARSITLLVTPKEAETIELAISTGKTRLLLRGTSDNGPADSDGVTFAELRRSTSGGFGADDPFAVRPAELVKPVSKPGSTVTPSTQPQQVAISTEIRRPRSTDRTVKIIRAGVETEVTVPEVAIPASRGWMTGTGADEVPAVNNDN
jgi:pilus assembly protein CpaB